MHLGDRRVVLRILVPGRPRPALIGQLRAQVEDAVHEDFRRAEQVFGDVDHIRLGHEGEELRADDLTARAALVNGFARFVPGDRQAMLQVEMLQIVVEQAVGDPARHSAVDPVGADLAARSDRRRRHDILDLHPAALLVEVDLLVAQYLWHIDDLRLSE